MRITIAKSLFAIALVVGTASASATGVSGQGNWESRLEAIDLGNNGTVDAFYDKDLNISWMADAGVSGLLNFGAAVKWASALNVEGVTGWHLPTINIDICQQNFTDTLGGDCGYDVPAATSDMAHMNRISLGNDSRPLGLDPTFNLLTNTGPFTNLNALGYWFSRDYAMDEWDDSKKYTDLAWRYSFAAGRQDWLNKSNELNAWAVHDGHVGMLMAAVPEPETYAMMLAGLGTVLLARRRRRDQQA